MSFPYGAQSTGSSPFGQPPAFVAQQPFGAPATAVSTVAPQFGAAGFGSPVQSTGLQFASQTTPAPAPTLFGQSQLGGYPMGAAAPTPASTFASPSLFGGATSAPITFSTVAPSTFGTVAPAVPTFGTGSTFASSVASPQGLSLVPATTVPPTSTQIGLGGLSTTAPKLNIASIVPQGLSLAPATTVPTTSAQIGLGGLSTTAPKQNITSTVPQGELPPKDQPLPNELLQTVDAFKAFLKEQKANSSEIARFSIKELKTIDGNIGILNNTINKLENEMQKNKWTAEKLKLDTVQTLQYAEMAQRTFEIPSGMQYDNTAPIQFFTHLLQNFEHDLQQLRFHLECVNKQIQNGGPQPLTPEDLSVGLRRLHQTFVTLAGRLQTVHNQVEIQKDLYLTLRRNLLNDHSNIFEPQTKELSALELALKSIANQSRAPEVVAGPSPFNSLGTGQAQLLAQSPPGTLLGQVPFEAKSTLGTNTKPMFGNLLGNTPSLFNNPTPNSFQLQKPPTGSKRGKT